MSAQVAADCSPLRLTRRGRLLFLGLPLMLLAALLVTMLGIFNSPATASTENPSSATSNVSYTVRPGDTVWTVAEVIADGRDTRDVVQAMMDLNDLETSVIQVGQQLFLPTGD
ncbi:LysM peptidoglycan-binding domain-containing protein [Arthrobacter sp. H14]|uniref:LysM peptidoglycan-binding domain-containing protein n=1 Tax=Arthrobacter sp. H14 TaxID=1312959 RepID=UPI0005690404|nr:LysM peptidoglycan-binding domain-containing protein [Arthrobacter sp. H14]